MRSSAANYMRSHPDEFLPFLTSDDDVGDGIMSPGSSPSSLPTRLRADTLTQGNTRDTATWWNEQQNGEDSPRSVFLPSLLPTQLLTLPPQILALSKHFGAPIHILQAGTDLVKVGDELPAGRGPMLISCVPLSPLRAIQQTHSGVRRYHRKMYGLGEVRSSLPKSRTQN